MTILRRPLVVLLVAVLAIEAVFGLLLDGPGSSLMACYRVLHLLEMLLLIGLVSWQFRLQSIESRWVLAGLVLSFGGDLVNSFLFDLSFLLKPQTLLSIPFFVAAHLCYVACFVRLLRQPPPGAAPTTGRHWLLALGLWPWLAVGLWQWIIDPHAAPLLLRLSMGYALVVTLMGVVAVLLGSRLGRRAWAPLLGGLCFVLSDAILGSFLMEGPDRPLLASQAIWLTYFLAQVLISRAPALRTGRQGHPPAVG